MVYGEQDEAGITDSERAILDNCSTTTVQTITGTGHMIPDMRPDAVADLITQALQETRATGSPVADQPASSHSR